METDTGPPPGAGIATSIVRRHVTLGLCHYDQASLWAGKLQAVLSRRWVKGRDYYDLGWYLADRTWPSPNVALLNAADAIRQRIATLDWERARADVRPFLERERDIALVTAEALGKLLSADG